MPPRTSTQPQPQAEQASDGQPDTLRPFAFHGIDFNWDGKAKEAVAECPWCGRENKFSVNIATGLWRCLLCAEGSDKGGGNIYTFLRKLWDLSLMATTPEDYEELAKDRRLVHADTLLQWDVCKSTTTRDWIVPGYNAEGKLTGLYRYIKTPEKMLLLPTPTLGQHLFGMKHFNPKCGTIDLMEGPWDGMAMWEVAGQCKFAGAGTMLARTANRGSSLLKERNVLASPGCNIFLESWLPLFSGKAVNLWYDNDHPRKHPKTGAAIAPAGYTAMQRVAGILSSYQDPPSEINFVQWGPDGHSDELPSGYDVRDALAGRKGTEPEPLASRVTSLFSLFERLAVAPAEWLKTPTKSLRKTGGKGAPADELLPCDTYKAMINTWRKALRWTDGLDRALAVMLASVTSTKSVGDQLWIKVIGPASCGKSTLCEALAMNTQYTKSVSTMRGFHSGFKSDGDGEEDNSLIELVKGKTLITKDGDTLLQSPNLPQILAEARDVYDSTSRSHYRNKAGRDYAGIRMTWLLCGTSSLRFIDSSELGERFLDCVIMEGIDDDLEDEILVRVANRVERNMAFSSDDDLKSQHDPDLMNAMMMTGGYVEYLRTNAISLLSAVSMDGPVRLQCARLGKFVAYMRARPSKMQDESSEREFAARLVSQLIRLAKCLAVVMNKGSVNEEVMARVTQVAMDTSRGKTLQIAHLLAKSPDGMDAKGLSVCTNSTDAKVRDLLRFLRQIGVAELFLPPKEPGARTVQPRWRLTAQLTRLYKDVT